MLKLSVIILNYNVRYFLEQCILSVQEAIASMDAEIIVIDNDSKDDSCAMVKERFPEITLLENKENIGFARANNQGVAIAKGEYICILNPDTVVGEDTFTRVLKKIPDLPHSGLVGVRLIDGTGNFLPESKRNIPSPLTSFRRLFGIKLGKVKNYYADHVSEKGIGDIDILVGAFFVVKRKDYLEVEGFDEDYFMYGEDIDLSYKIKKKGLENYYLGNLAVIHYKGESTDRNATYIRRFYGAMRLFYKKHFKSNWVLDVLVSVGIRFISIIQSLRNYDKEKRTIDQYYLISENSDLARKISAKLNKNVISTSLESIEDLGDKNIEIIFDNDYITFGEIINQMQNLKSNHCTFKIRPKKCNYIVGSDFSDGKGEVVIF
ncbi:glycosyltransferase family 2 protein [Aquimarina sp. 2201CG5-10]|uniref:glycosyltransferase family 2 protein n=1 Tax=Aquimarina callyspongiae TaxID=3098150 RepID=UPI002AB440B1|nr:glycosyltransferase family 2 protein [Aquimarina sp. 2201CG5-10]MDY8134089.1 glycosyltransferase family 2 protein [Aquimarina sp. 2201CG5-10]